MMTRLNFEVFFQRFTWPLLLLIFLLSVQAAEDRCPRGCVCTENKAYCDYLALKSIPKHLPRTLQYLYLRDNHIRRISASRLAGFKDLRHLLVKGNKIRTIDAKAFRDTTMLVSLSLTDNSLRRIPASTFLPLGRLRVLSIRNNKLVDIEGLFTFLSKLRLLNLGNNRIKVLTDRTFMGTPSMEILDMHSNNIRFVDKHAFSSMPNLKYLVLRDNIISDIDLMFVPSVQFELLDLSNCRLNKVPAGLPCSIVDLRLSDNRIKQVNKSDFANTTKVRLLVLTGNEIQNVETGAFSGLEQLYDLYLVSNQLKEIPSGLPKNIHGLYANFNNITEVQEGTFSTNNQMEYLYIRNNQIRHIEQTAFQGLYHLRGLDLSRNDIKEVKSYTFAQMPDLELLDVSKNPLNKLEKGSLTGLMGLNILQMAHVNPVGKLPKDLFKDLGRLRFLDLSSSPELVEGLLANPKQLLPLQRVEDLNLMNNNLHNIPAVLPRLLRNVRLMKIVGNPWHCDTHIATLLGWLRNSTSTDFYGRHYLTCASPPDLKGQIVHDLMPDQLPLPTPPPYSVDEPGIIVFKIINEGDDPVNFTIATDSGDIYYSRTDELQHHSNTGGKPKLSLLKEDENVNVNIYTEDGVEVEEIDSFDQDTDLIQPIRTQRQPGKPSQKLTYNNQAPYSGAYQIRQGLAHPGPYDNYVPEDLDISMEIPDDEIKDSTEDDIKDSRFTENSGFTSGDHV